jgi:hypothetical protein
MDLKKNKKHDWIMKLALFLIHKNLRLEPADLKDSVNAEVKIA